MTKQEAVIKYITENYLEYNRLRHDVISDKLQLRMEKRSDRPNGLLEVRPSEGLLDRSLHSLLDNSKNLTMNEVNGLTESEANDLTAKHSNSSPRERSVWREMTKQDINSIVCHCAQEYNANITTREVITALQSDLIPDVHPLREYILSLRPYTPDQPDWIDFVAQQVRVRDSAQDRPAGCRSAQVPVDGRSAAPVVFHNESTASGEGDTYKNDNLDNLHPNQYPLGALGEDKNQQLKQLDSTTYSARNNTASGEGNSTSPDRPYRAERPMNLTGEADLTVSEAHGLASNSSLRERSEADRLWRVCFKKWFVAMVASWMKDEVVNHQVLVLIGRQGIYKTTWLEHLIPPHLRAYTCKLANSNDLNKDERLRIAEFGLISLDEIDSMNNRELNQLKSVITATDVNERAAYAYTKERRVRLASFCASGNRRDFLTDITGNRRWLPFEVESIQNPFYTTLPYELMYAQAWALAQDPMFSYWFELDEIAVLEQHNQHFRDESNEEQLLDVYFAVPPTDATTAKFLTTAEISERLIYYGNIKKPMTLSRLGVLLSQKGFLSVRRGNPSRRGWIIYERESQEVNAERSILSK